jgi:hypothetical protein
VLVELRVSPLPPRFASRSRGSVEMTERGSESALDVDLE